MQFIYPFWLVSANTGLNPSFIAYINFNTFSNFLHFSSLSLLGCKMGIIIKGYGED